MDKNNLKKVEGLIEENKSFKKKNEILINKLLKENPRSAQIIEPVINILDKCIGNKETKTSAGRLKILIKENQKLKEIYDYLKDIEISDSYNIKDIDAAVKFFKKSSDNIINKLEEIISKELEKNFSESHNVIVQNPIKNIIVDSILNEIMIKNFPESFKISNLKDIKQQEFPKSFIVKSKRFVEIKKQIELLVKDNKRLIEVIEKQTENGREVKITNSKPKDAIPVVLTTEDKQRFYNVMMQVLGAAGTDPKKLDNIISNTRIPSVVGHGSLTIANAGTPGNLPNVACKRVVIQANEGNTGRIAIGGSNAVRAALGTRNAIYLYKTWRQEFNVSNLNLLWVDVVVNGEGITYTYEN